MVLLLLLLLLLLYLSPSIVIDFSRIQALVILWLSRCEAFCQVTFRGYQCNLLLDYEVCFAIVCGDDSGMNLIQFQDSEVGKGHIYSPNYSWDDYQVGAEQYDTTQFQMFILEHLLGVHVCSQVPSGLGMAVLTVRKESVLAQSSDFRAQVILISSRVSLSGEFRLGARVHNISTCITNLTNNSRLVKWPVMTKIVWLRLRKNTPPSSCDNVTSCRRRSQHAVGRTVTLSQLLLTPVLVWYQYTIMHDHKVLPPQ